MPPIDDATVAAEIAADAATVAANAALAAEAASEPQIDPNALLAADVEIARIEGETERARIEARAETKIAELNTQEPAWLSDIRASLARVEGTLEAIALHLLSTPPITAPITMMPPVVVEDSPGAVVDGPQVVETETAPTVEPSEQTEAPAAPARQRPRWI